MVSFDEMIGRCDALIRLLEQDREEIAGCMRGDLMEAYRDYVDRELQKVQEIRKKLVITMA